MDIQYARKIFNLMEDDLSKYIFEERLLYSISNDKRHILNIIKKIDGLKYFTESLLNDEKIHIFGAGIRAKQLIKYYNDKIGFVFDNNPSKWGTIVEGKKILQFSRENVLEGEKIVICNKYDSSTIVDQIIKNGISENNIINIGDVWTKMLETQYFDCPNLSRRKSEVFIDGGCLDGKTSELFLKWARGSKCKIYCFEPDSNQKDIIKKNNNIAELSTIIQKGLWKEHDYLKFNQTEAGTSKIGDIGGSIIEVDSLDNILHLEEVTFIKMDIEGAEKEALQGARQIISQQKPKLAICIYHKPEDILEIPSIILNINPDYRFYMRHYSPFCTETVLYAI